MTVSLNNKFYLKIYNYEINNLLNHTTFLEKSNRYNIFTGTVPPAGAVLFLCGKDGSCFVLSAFPSKKYGSTGFFKVILNLYNSGKYMPKTAGFVQYRAASAGINRHLKVTAAEMPDVIKKGKGWSK